MSNMINVPLDNGSGVYMNFGGRLYGGARQYSPDEMKARGVERWQESVMDVSGGRAAMGWFISRRRFWYLRCISLFFFKKLSQSASQPYCLRPTHEKVVTLSLSPAPTRILAQNQHEIGTKSARNRHEISTKSARNRHEIGTKSARNRHKISTRSARNRHEISTKSAQIRTNQHKISTKSARNQQAAHSSLETTKITSKLEV